MPRAGRWRCQVELRRVARVLESPGLGGIENTVNIALAGRSVNDLSAPRASSNPRSDGALIITVPNRDRVAVAGA